MQRTLATNKMSAYQFNCEFKAHIISKRLLAKATTHTAGYVVWERDISNTQGWSVIHWKAREKPLGNSYTVAKVNAMCQETARQLNRLAVKRESLPDCLLGAA